MCFTPRVFLPHNTIWVVTIIDTHGATLVTTNRAKSVHTIVTRFQDFPFVICHCNHHSEYAFTPQYGHLS